MIFMDNTKPYPSSDAFIQDEKNKETIARGSLFSAVWSFITKTKRPLTPKQIRLLYYATPKERALFLEFRFVLRLFSLFLIFVVLYFSIFATRFEGWLAPTVQAAEAGTIKSIDVREGRTAVFTTIRGFHVHGAVSAAPGDEVRVELKKLPGFRARQWLCIDSNTKTGCYRLTPSNFLGIYGRYRPIPMPIKPFVSSASITNGSKMESTETTEAGTITSIELHRFPNNVATTVTTTAGVFQVHGAVSGAIGDEARLEVKKM